MNGRLCSTGILVLVLGITGNACGHRHVVKAVDVGCSPTGWVDRIEGNQVVLTDDDGKAEVVPLRCFATAPQEGTFVSMGTVDLYRTGEVRSNMQRLLDEIGVEELP